MPLFGRIHSVIRQAAGAWVDGKWHPALEPDPVSVTLDVQPARYRDYEEVKANVGGQELSGLLIGYGGTAAPLTEGDVLLYGGARWKCISAPPPRDTLGSDVAHCKYWFTREVAPG